MSSVEDPPVEPTVVGPGTVEVSLSLPVPPARALEALTEPAAVACWFGELTPGLRPRGAARLDFGDGDFFALSDIHLAPPRAVEYRWRFLGTGPLDTVRWRVAPHADGCTVTVNDTEPFRSPEAVAMLREGWLDFTGRLAGFLTTGQPTRYDWRRELDGSAELPCAPAKAGRLLADDEAQSAWLPFGVPLTEGVEFTPPDGLLPRTFVVRRLRREGSSAASFEIASEGWLSHTECSLELTEHGPHSLLVFSHTGWEGISRDPAEQLAQRQRFCALWVAALERARALAGGTSFHARDV